MAYSKKTWSNEETITDAALNNIENGIEAVDKAIPNNATKSKAGRVKQVTLVPDASGENVTKEEFNALLAALKTAGIMASS